MFLEENKFPRTVLAARKVAGSATYKQYETVSPFKVGLFIQSSPLIKISSPKLHSA